jgi:hypothetical protein
LPLLGIEVFENSAGGAKVGRIEALDKTAVYRSQNLPSILGPALADSPAGETESSAPLEKQSSLLAGDLQSGLEALIDGRTALLVRFRKQELSFEAKEFGDVIPLATLIGILDRLLDRGEGFGEASQTGKSLGESAQDLRITVVPSDSLAGIELRAE